LLFKQCLGFCPVVARASLGAAVCLPEIIGAKFKGSVL
jgi:hypothetical protein